MPATAPFPYFVGAQSLHDLANRRSRVCVMNILGTESIQVTPMSHVFSGGNVVAGVQYGSSGELLETAAGPIPVYGSVTEVLKAGHGFDTGVIYLPPAAVSHAVSELCVRNEELKRIYIVTEKVAVRDSRLIRYVAQNRRVDVLGANSLGIGNSWDQVRIGGGLGGDNPADCLKRGSIAIYSNSGNFCTTLAEYLKTCGFGTSTIFSSGKDLYIHFALAEFLYCAENDPRTKAVVVYSEPGGYYEKQALDWISEGRLPFSKPLVVCVTGRWKSFLARPCGHAGAMAGGSDDAAAKEAWFDRYFQVPAFSPANPQVGPRGVRVTSIQDLPAAVAAVMAERGEAPDFAPAGDLSLKPWLVNQQGHPMHESLRLAPVTPLSPYDRQLAEANRLVGACLVRESMRNSSSATRVVAATQQTELYGTPILDLIEQPFAATALFALLRQPLPAAAHPLADLVLNWFSWRAQEGSGQLAAQVRANGGNPNAALAAEVLLTGQNAFFRELEQTSEALIETFFHQSATATELSEPPTPKALEVLETLPKGPVTDQDRAWAAACAQLVKAQGVETVLSRFAEQYSAREASAEKASNPMTLLAVSLLLGWAWPALKSRRIPRQTAVEMGIHLALLGLITRAGAVAPLWPPTGPEDRAQNFAQTLFHSLFGRTPTTADCFALNALLNLTVSNGPGTLSVMGAKGSVSAGNQISTAYAGFMTHTGLAHGGNGYKAVAFLLGVFAGHDPYALTAAEREALLLRLAQEQAQSFLAAKRSARGANPPQPIPCINHPVFRGQAVNLDPREERLRSLLAAQGLRNPFLEFYHHLVEQLFAVGATRNVFCVNVDAVIATLSLELFWPQWRAGQVTPEAMQDAVFRLFLYGRMPGIAAEVADHRSRGTDMDCRTPNGELRYLS